jgi:methionyl-tRNA formyltransferase
MRVVVIAPVSSSPVARVVAARLGSEPGIQLVGGIVRAVTWRRFAGEFRRDGSVLLRKAWRAFALGSYQGDLASTSIATDLVTLGISERSFDDILASAGAPLHRAEDLNARGSIAFVEGLRPDVVVFTGGGLLRGPLLRASGAGVLNAHMGILPAYRGMDVIRWAILEHQRPQAYLGVTVHFMDEGVDTGPILATTRIEPAPGDSIESLTNRFFPVMADMLVTTVRRISQGNVTPEPQRAEDGRQYFTMHPRMAAIVNSRVATLGR